MEHNRRAAMRREKKRNDKVMNAKGNTPEVLMRKAFQAGKNEGLELAIALTFLALHENYNFGTKRLMQLMDYISVQSRKMDELPTKFNVDWYVQQLYEKCDILIKRE